MKEEAVQTYGNILRKAGANISLEAPLRSIVDKYRVDDAFLISVAIVKKNIETLGSMSQQYIHRWWQFSLYKEYRRLIQINPNLFVENERTPLLRSTHMTRDEVWTSLTKSKNPTLKKVMKKRAQKKYNFLGKVGIILSWGLNILREKHNTLLYIQNLTSHVNNFSIFQ